MTTESKPRTLNEVLNDIDLMVEDISKASYAITEMIPESPDEWGTRERAMYYVARALETQTDHAKKLVLEAFQVALWDKNDTSEGGAP